MQTSASASIFHTVQTMELKQNEHKHPPAQGEGICADWATPTSAASIFVDLISKIAASDVAQVGDLMINGRKDAVLAPRVPSRA